MNYYVATGINTDDRLVQVCVEVDPGDKQYMAAVKCCHKAQEFWINRLRSYRLKQMTTIKQLHGMDRYE